MVKPHSVGRHGDRGGNLTQHDAKRHERGQAMVEFTLTITVTLLLVFGMMDLGRAVYTASVIQWAAQQGARAGIVDASPAYVRAAVESRLAGLNPNLATITVSTPGVNMVQVDVSYPYELMVPMIARITGESIPLSASASMVAY